MEELFTKYNVPAPRYTSYPTIPHWSTEYTTSDWQKNLINISQEDLSKGISIYIHLPYCEELCTYCGCHKIITKQHDKVETPYIDALLKEWELYKSIIGRSLKINEIHLGGGTPTYFSSENLQQLINGILEGNALCDNYELSIEGHPNYTSSNQLETLHKLGFNRISFGIQDFDIKVQKAINRIQSFEQVERITNKSKELGFTSVNYDLIYGLPFQEKTSIRETIKKVTSIKPDRIAFYAYAHVPTIKKVQRLYDENDLPTGKEKRALYDLGAKLLQEAGYKKIGMDHFALNDDKLQTAYVNKSLNRNFMGYTTNTNEVLIGLGVSSISETPDGYAQNEKSIHKYLKTLDTGFIPIIKGQRLSNDNRTHKSIINSLIIKYEADLSSLPTEFISTIKNKLIELQQDGLIHINEFKIQVTEQGKVFVRNICMLFDEFEQNTDRKKTFSSSI